MIMAVTPAQYFSILGDIFIGSVFILLPLLIAYGITHLITNKKGNK
jgi:hypothetical protein